MNTKKLNYLWFLKIIKFKKGISNYSIYQRRQLLSSAAELKHFATNNEFVDDFIEDDGYNDVDGFHVDDDEELYLIILTNWKKIINNTIFLYS